MGLIFVIVLGLLLATSIGTSVPGLMFLFIAAHILSYALHLSIGITGSIALGLLLVAFPLVSVIAAALLDKFCALGPNRTTLQSIAICLTMALIFESNAFVGYLESALQIAQEPSTSHLLAFVVSVFNSVLFCAGLIAFSAIILSVLFEFPLSWISSAASIRLVVPSAALRQLIVLMTLSLTFNFAIGLCVAELKPTIIFNGINRSP